MTLDELIQELTELKESGKEIGKYKVVFRRNQHPDKEIDRIKVRTGSITGGVDRIELINLF